jgi:ABC-type transporter Mla MlaB component
MLRVTIHENGGRPSIQLEGKLMGPWVVPARECWDRLLSEGRTEPIEVDLRAVSHIDNAGRALLAEMISRNSKLITCDCQMKAIVAEIALSGQNPVNRAQRSRS